MLKGGEDIQKNSILLWIILFFAIISISSAGAVFQLMEEVKPMLRASWRFQLTAILMFPMFVIQYRQCRQQPEIMAKLMDKETMYILLGSGLSLGLHMGAWVWSLDNTSLTHSLLLVTIHPLLLVTGALLLRRFVPAKQIAGAIVGFAGASVTLLGISSEVDATLIGDIAAIFGAVAILGYLIAGSKLRKWMPLFVYIFPVTFIAAIQLAIISLISEGSTFSMSDADISVLGWMALSWLPYVLYLAVFPGIVGHAGISMVLRWFPPIIVSVAYLFEPLIGSIIGWFLGTTEAPSIWTWVGGTILIVGMVLIISEQNKNDTMEGGENE